MSIAEAGVTEAQQRLMKLEQDKEEIDKQLRQTQEAVLAGKHRVEQLREEVQKRTEARTVNPMINMTDVCNSWSLFWRLHIVMGVKEISAQLVLAMMLKVLSCKATLHCAPCIYEDTSF